jgi:outer membrane protein TolC
MRTTRWFGPAPTPALAALGRVLVLVLALTGGLAGRASAQVTADTLPLGEALALARDANPMIQTMRLRADAAAEQIPQAGAWSNPVLAVGLRNRPIDDFGTDQPMTMNVIELRQQIPWPGKLGFSKERATHVAAAESLEVDELEAQLLARVKSVYYRLAYVDRALDIMRETRELLRNFLDVSSALYAVGSGLQQDVLQAQIAIAQMTEDITVMEQDRVATAARLNALLGRYATIPIGLLELPGPGGPLMPVDSLMLVAAEARPALAAARRRVEAADAGYRAARRQLYPDFMVTLGYGQRPQYTDFVTLMVAVSVPLFAGSRQLPLRPADRAAGPGRAGAQPLHSLCRLRVAAGARSSRVGALSIPCRPRGLHDARGQRNDNQPL